MEIILLENIINLGNIGDKVSVKNGYGRNYLLKQGKALRFNKENLELVKKKKDELNKKNIETKNKFNIKSPSLADPIKNITTNLIEKSILPSPIFKFHKSKK